MRRAGLMTVLTIVVTLMLSAVAVRAAPQAAVARPADRTTSFTSLCAGGAIAGVVTTARLGLAGAAMDYATLGAVAAASAGAGCALAVLMQGTVVDCINGSMQLEPVGLFACTVSAVDRLGGAAEATPGAASGPATARGHKDGD